MSSNVSGNLKDLTGTATTKNAFLRFILRGTNGGVPRVPGVAILSGKTGSSWYQDFTPDPTTGAISGTLYSTRDAAGTGNGDIEVGGSFTAVWYGMVLHTDGLPGPEVPVHAQSGVTLNPSSVSPLSSTPTVVAPTGDVIYARLDGANQPFSDSAVVGFSDVRLSRVSAGVLGVGNGTLADASKTIAANTFTGATVIVGDGTAAANAVQNTAAAGDGMNRTATPVHAWNTAVGGARHHSVTTGGAQVGSGDAFGFSSNADPSQAAADTSLSRASANTLQLGNTAGTPDASGTLNLAKVVATNSGGGLSASVQAVASNAGILVENTGAAADNKIWDIASSTAQSALLFRAINDAQSVFAPYMTVTRSGASISSVLMASPVQIGASDTGISRTAAKTVAIGNGTQGDGTGTLVVSHVSGSIDMQSGDGTAGAPSYSFIAGPTTGMFRAVSTIESVSTSVAGTSRFAAVPAGAQVGSGGVLGFSSAVAPGGAAADTGMSRVSAGVVGVGNGTAGDVSGQVSAGTLKLGGGTALSTTNQTGTGNLVLASSPTLTTPNIGAASGTSLSVSGNIASTAGSVTGASGVVSGAGFTEFEITPNSTTAPTRRGLTMAADPAGDVTLWYNTSQSGAGYFFKNGANGNTLTVPSNVSDTLVARNTTDTLTNKTLTSPVISTISNSGTLTLPTATDTLVGRATTDTLTNKRVTPRVQTAADATSITPTSDSADLCIQTNTQIAGTLTIANATGTPTEGQKLLIRVKTTNAQAYSFGTNYRGSVTQALPTTTVATKTDYLFFSWNAVDSKWDLGGYIQGVA